MECDSGVALESCTGWDEGGYRVSLMNAIVG